MSESKVFKCMAGLVQLEKVYWSDSSNTTMSGLANIISLYSDEKRRQPVYLHINVSDLFLCAGTATQRVQEGTKIVVDVVALSKDNIVKQKDANNLQAVKDSVQPFAECILDLEPGGKSINEGANGDVVSGLSKVKTDLTVTIMYARKGGSGEVAYAYDLCFEVQFTDEQYARLFDKKNKNRYLFAWAWTINKQAISEYKRVSNVPVGTAKERLEFLKQGEQSYLEYAIDYYKEKLLSGSYLPRHQYGAAGFVDNFPFDEPSCNFLKVENALPFSFFGAGAQFGPIGLCRKDSEYHKKYISKYPATEDFIVKEGEKLRDATLPELYLDEPCGSDGGGAAQFGHGLLSDQDEYHSFGDHCFLFKKDSAVLKINSIEDNSGKAVSVSKAYSFSSGKCEIVFHDYVADYRDRFKDVLLMQFDIVMEQKVVDFNEFATLQIAPEDSLKSEDGEVLALIEKGVPGYGYTGCCHTDVKLRGQKNAAQLWEAHTLVHRPLIIVYELERDLTTEEVDVLRKTPITCTFQFGTIGRLKSAEYKIPIDTTNGAKKGRHAIFVYLVSKYPRVEVVITDDTLVPAVDRIAGYGEKSKYRGFNWPLSGLPQVTLYENRNETGLFENNPVVIIDDFSWSDIAAKNNTDARAAAARAINSKCMGFLLSFVPYVGDIAGTAWDIGVEMLEGKPVNDATKITISKKAMNLFLECLQKATTPAAGTRSSGLPNFKELGKGPGKALDFFVVLATIEQVLKGYLDTVAKTSSSFLRGVDFGKGDKDSLYLMAVKTIQLNQNSKTLEYSKVETPDTVEIFMNRELTGDDHQPFNIQLGATAGLCSVQMQISRIL